jgi:hypothetical protein
MVVTVQGRRGKQSGYLSYYKPLQIISHYRSLRSSVSTLSTVNTVNTQGPQGRSSEPLGASEASKSECESGNQSQSEA